MGKGNVARLWPKGLRSVGEMLEASAIVGFHCQRCGNLFDIDLHAISIVRGCSYSLIDVRPQCKISTCRGTGHFLAKLQGEPCMRPLLTIPPEFGT